MQKLTAKDIWPTPVYERAREEFRSRIIALKKPRRVELGDSVTLLFENRDTMKFQIQEMVRVENIKTPEGVQAEIDVYNGLVPGEGELAATLMIDVTDEAQIPIVLQRLLGLDEHLYLRFGGSEVRARFEAGQTDGARLSAVQFVHFTLNPEQRREFLGAKVASLELRHPNYQAKRALEGETLASLQRDLES
jgi:hypothetical protein